MDHILYNHNISKEIKQLNLPLWILAVFSLNISHCLASSSVHLKSWFFFFFFYPELLSEGSLLRVLHPSYYQKRKCSQFLNLKIETVVLNQ